MFYFYIGEELYNSSLKRGYYIPIENKYLNKNGCLYKNVAEQLYVPKESFWWSTRQEALNFYIKYKLTEAPKQEEV